MADYYPLIARAVAGLDKNTGENRRALYERARTALVAQLRGVSPALDESEITRERLALEEAIRKIEAEAVRQARETPRPPPPRPQFREPPPPAPASPPPSSPPPSSREPMPRREPPRPSSPQPPPRAPSGPGSLDAPPPAPPRRDRPASTRSLSEEAMKGFRDVVADPNAVAASHQAEPAPPPAPRPSAPPRRPERTLFTPPAAPAAPSPPPAYERPERRAEPESAALPPSPSDWTPPYPETPQEAVDYDATRPPNARLRPRPEDDEPEVLSQPVPPPPRRLRSYRGAIRMALVLALVGIVAALAFWQRGAISGAFGSLVAMIGGSSTPSRDAGSTAPSRPKITDRIGQPGNVQQPAGAPAVAQRVVLYEEDPNDPQGKRLVGTAVWRTETLPAAPGRAPELAVRADVEIPERKMTMTWSLRRNTDSALPASHTIEIMFNLAGDPSAGGGVQNVPGVLMKQAEQTRGVPLAGLAVKVTPGFFLIGLSSLETDVARNLQLLKERSWFDIPIVYNNNRRAILAMEKGTPGERAFAEAFATWKQ